VKIDDIKVNGDIVLKDVTAVIDAGAHSITIGDPERVLALHLVAGGSYKGNGYYTCEFRSILVLLIDSL
jgi:hypothetical protein